MGILKRGVRNAFRNSIRTLAITIIIGISIGLALVMLLSRNTVQAKIESVQSSIGNTVTISPAGARGFDGGGEPLTSKDVSPLSSISHVNSVSSTFLDRMIPGTDTSLASAIEAGTLGNRQGQFRSRDIQQNNPRIQVNTSGFKIPITTVGADSLANAQLLGGGTTTVSDGAAPDMTSDDNKALVGKELATKNNLSVGSTFKAYGTDITVSGIYDAGNEFSNNSVVFPITSLRRLSNHPDEVSTTIVKVDSITNMSSTVQAIKDKLGSKADIVSSEDTAKSAIEPLEKIRTISTYSLLGALIAGSVITLLSMIMIVRERRREIGVLKAIGASNILVMSQFVIEALVFTLMGSVVGMIFGVALSNPILKALVSSNEAAPTVNTVRSIGGAGGAVVRFGGAAAGQLRDTVQNLHAAVDITIILYGLLAAIGIAIIGSAIPAYMISRLRPAEVMRGE